MPGDDQAVDEPAQRADDGCRPGRRPAPASPTSRRRPPAQTPAERQRRADREVEGAGDHQQHHAADEDADRRQVEQHGAHVGGGREIVRVDDASSPPRAATTSTNSVSSREFGERAARRARTALSRRRSALSAMRLRRPVPSLMPRHPLPCGASATEAVYLRGEPQHLLLALRRRPASSPTVRPSAITTMRSASASTSGRSDETTSSATPLSASAAQQAVDLGAGADVDAARRLVDDQQPRLHRQPLGEQHLLLVAAREVADDLARRSGVAMRSSSTKRSRQRLGLARREKIAAGGDLVAAPSPRCC